MMNIKICKTNEISDVEWDAYVNGFNTVFNKEFEKDHFIHKYTAFCGYSYHSLLIEGNSRVVGCVTVIPQRYLKGTKQIVNCLAVDVFILESFRTDPLMLRKMYSQLKELLLKDNVTSVIAVPNDIAYVYWKNIVKWKDVGLIDYWILPVKIESIIPKLKLLRNISKIFVKFLLLVNLFLSYIYNSSQKISKYELVVDDLYRSNRFNSKHKTIVKNNIRFTYAIYNENGTQTAYLIEVSELNRISYRSLVKAISYIFKNENIDLIVYVGKLKLVQALIIKVPSKFQPKKLPLMCDIINKKNKDLYNDMYDINNWNFGLLNYDVR